MKYLLTTIVFFSLLVATFCKSNNIQKTDNLKEKKISITKKLTLDNRNIKFSIDSPIGKNYSIKEPNYYGTFKPDNWKNHLRVYIDDKNNERLMFIDISEMKKLVPEQKLHDYIVKSAKNNFHSVIKTEKFSNKNFAGYYVVGESNYDYKKRKRENTVKEYTLSTIFNYGNYGVNIRVHIKDILSLDEKLKMINSITIQKGKKFNAEAVEKQRKKNIPNFSFDAKNHLNLQFKFLTYDKSKNMTVLEIFRDKEKRLGTINISKLNTMFSNKNYFRFYVKTVKETMCKDSSDIEVVNYNNFKGFYFTGKLKGVDSKINRSNLWIIAKYNNYLILLTLDCKSKEKITKYLNYFKTIELKDK